MKITKSNNIISIDFENDIIYTLNDIGINILNNDVYERIHISNLTMIGKESYSNLTFKQKIKLMVMLFKTLFISK